MERWLAPSLFSRDALAFKMWVIISCSCANFSLFLQHLICLRQLRRFLLWSEENLHFCFKSVLNLNTNYFLTVFWRGDGWYKMLNKALPGIYGFILKLIIATIIYWGTITVFFILIIPIYRLFTIYKGRVNNKVW